MRGTLQVWIGLMGLAGTGAVWLLLGTFPRAFVDSSPAVAWPWRHDAGRSARVTGGILVGAGVASLAVIVAGIVGLVSVH